MQHSEPLAREEIDILYIKWWFQKLIGKNCHTQPGNLSKGGGVGTQDSQWNLLATDEAAAPKCNEPMFLSFIFLPFALFQLNVANIQKTCHSTRSKCSSSQQI